MESFGGNSWRSCQVMVRSWGAKGEGGWGRRHSEMRGLGTAVQGFAFEKRASVAELRSGRASVAAAESGVLKRGARVLPMVLAVIRARSVAAPSVNQRGP